MSDNDCICPPVSMYVTLDCPVHGDGLKGCTCQYRGTTPKWYITVKTCPIHAATYDPMQAPEWAATKCGPEGVEVWRDREHLLLTSKPIVEETRWSWDV